MNHGDEEQGAHGDALNRYPVRRSTLSWKEDQMMARIIGAVIAVHRELGVGFLESIYKRAMCVELQARGLSFEKERAIRVSYRGVDVHRPTMGALLDSL